MKKIKINISTIRSIFSSLEKECLGNKTETTTERVLEFNNEIGSGIIKGFNFNTNISYISYDVKFTENTLLIFDQDTNKQALNYFYCSEGQLKHHFKNSTDNVTFSSMQTAIFSNSEGNANHIFIEKDTCQKFTMISFLATKPISESTDEFTGQLLQLFQSKEVDGVFNYVSSYNLKIREKLNQIETVSTDDIASELLRKGMLQVSLSMIVNQYFEDVKRSEENVHGLSRTEIQTVKEMSEFIKNYPDQQFDLNYISRKSGLTPAKLQEGFKALFGRTVSNFIKNVRVELAERLIKTSDLSISEIVYTIGFSSRSYFSKIFKEKYNCSPKEYQDRNSLPRMTA
ncbi:AraC family transcriptional regulator [Kordia zhangzhouensis]|uniref:AraC family transcriptional regulator n=1 Tax=Kordia zhangzhouensis TaxID=1620405 RepID=UPI0006294FD3|nr:AraC family transcriptional regulator [Kordia zhangzhouensis]